MTNSTASSTLVAQALGAGDEREATAYGWDTTAIALVTQLLIAGVMALFARPIATVFTAETVQLTTDFIRVFALTIAGSSVSRSMRGALRGAGDTTWPLFGKIAGLVARLGIVALALPVGFTFTLVGYSVAPGLGLGVAAVYAAILVDFYIQAGVNVARFWTGKWQIVADRAEAGRTASDD